MKKIVTLLAVLLIDFILLDFVAAESEFTIMSDGLFAFLLLFLTLAMTLFLFYEQHFQKAHENWRTFYQTRADDLFKSSRKLATPVVIPKTLPKVKNPPSLDIQYEFIELVKNQIIEMREQGRSDGEIIAFLKSEKWDPQVIFIALGRVKKR